MNFDDAIKAHTAWKMKLANYIRKPDGSLQPGEIRLDGKCDLGKWIHGEGAQFSHMPEFQTLKKEHARFHVAAAEVVQKADLGIPTTEDIALGSKSEFASASNAVVSAIMSLRRQAA